MNFQRLAADTGQFEILSVEALESRTVSELKCLVHRSTKLAYSTFNILFRSEYNF